MFVHTTNQLRNSCIVNEHKTKDLQGQGSSNITVSLFVSFVVYQPSYPFISLYLTIPQQTALLLLFHLFYSYF